MVYSRNASKARVYHKNVDAPQNAHN